MERCQTNSSRRGYSHNSCHRLFSKMSVKDVYDYLRACLYNNEFSERTLELTKDALILNAANYTVWQYRRMILQHLGKNYLEQELLFSKSMIVDHQKNYQVWHHRMVIIQWLNDPGNELNFISQMLSEDPKNYHAWQYRQWILSTFKLYENELEYTNQLLEDDIRNNSAWNHRYFVINHTTDFAEETIQKEITFTLNAIQKAPKNESPWNYLRGLLIHTSIGLLDPQVVQFCEKYYSHENRSPHLLAYLIDVASEYADVHPRTPETSELLKRAIGMCSDLANTHDKIRQNYWNYISRTLEDKLEKNKIECDNNTILE
nr:protein farnesyltransferase/geranylgeranyltransferase type-1 subunit alpha isoform X2 [Halyomorpha halys]